MPRHEKLEMRIDQVEQRLAQVERGNGDARDFVSRVARMGVIVGCAGGLIGGANTLMNWWERALASANIEAVPAEALAVRWDPVARSATFTWGLVVRNDGERNGEVTDVRAYLSPYSVSESKSTTTREVDDVRLRERGESVSFPFTVKAKDSRDVQIIMVSKAVSADRSPAAVQQSPQLSPGIYRLVVDLRDSKRTYEQNYCFSLGEEALNQLNAEGFANFRDNDPLCVS